MLSAEDIISLEKKWLKYKIKEKSKFFILFTLVICLIVGLYLYRNVFQEFTQKSSQIVATSTVKESPLPTQEVKPIASTKSYEPIVVPTEEKNISKTEDTVENINETKKTLDEPIKVVDAEPKNVSIEKNATPFHLKLLPVLKGNNMFTTTSELIFHRPFSDLKTEKPLEKKMDTKKANIENTSQKVEDKKLNIDISTTEIDTIKYLENKFYATENIVFAIMLSEEHYNAKNYNDSIKWALTANEIDSKNDKSWYWFAKNKVKLGQKDDAIKAIETFLGNNTSRRLTDLLKDIKYGDTND